jgi:hypothetical protein
MNSRFLKENRLLKQRLTKRQADENEVEATKAHLAGLGGETGHSVVNEAALDEADQAMAEHDIPNEVETVTE